MILAFVLTLLFIHHGSVTGQSTNELAESLCSQTPLTLENDYLTECSKRGVNNCTEAWETFAQSFEKKHPHDVGLSDYEPYFDVIPIIAAPNQSLFWSGTYELSELVSCMCSTGANLVSSSNTPSSAIINGIGDINWCGNTEGIDFDSPCLCSVTYNFWNQFSVEFATVAKQTIFFLAYGEREGGAFQSTSAFASYEVPNLEYPRVSGSVVLNVHRKGEGESCGQGTLSTLQDTLESKQFVYSCYNIYGDLNDQTQTDSLVMCTSLIVNATQRGVDPEPNSCFSVQDSGYDIMKGSLSVMIVAVILALQWN